MKKSVIAVAAALVASSGAALAADLPMVRKAPIAVPVAPNPFDIAFGSWIASDYNFRGISQSAHKPAVGVYFEPRYNINSAVQLYVGLGGESIDFPNHAAAEVDFYGGARFTAGMFGLDVGAWYYWYPGGITFNGLGPTAGTSNASCTNGFVSGLGPSCNVMKSDDSFWEVYAKPTVTFNDFFSIGGNVFYSPNWLNTGAPGTYASFTAKLTAPATMLPNGIGAYISGEIGHYWLGTTDAFYGTIFFPGGVDLPDYTTWNVGLALTYKVFTADFRYYGTDLSSASCNVLTGDHTAVFQASAISGINPQGLVSNWCNNWFVAKFSVDTTLNGQK